MAKIDWATDEDVARYYGGIEFLGRWVGKSLRRGMAVAGFGALLEEKEGVWFAFLEVPASERKPSIYRHVLEAFNKVKELEPKVIKATCDNSIPRAGELMKRLGFEPSDEKINGREVWIWRN